jgi:GNAT superfamily N-acetyltransferase
MGQKVAVTLREIAESSEFAAMYPLVKLTNPDLTRRDFDALLAEMRPQGYRCVGAWQGGKLVAICGFWRGTRFWCRRFIDLDNVVVEPRLRSTGIGKKLVAWVEKEAKRHKCSLMGLDSYTTAHAAHRFYFREGYIILGYHFVKKLKP